MSSLLSVRATMRSNPEFLKWLQTYEEGIAKFRDRDFTEAKILFSRFLEFYAGRFSGEDVSRTALEYEQSRRRTRIGTPSKCLRRSDAAHAGLSSLSA